MTRWWWRGTTTSRPSPKVAAQEIEDRVAFWKGVKVVKDGDQPAGARLTPRTTL